MTNRQHWLTPPHDQVYKWWEEACKRPPSSFYEKLDYVAAKAAEFGWQERDASVPRELQEARDEELDACCKWVDKWIEEYADCGDALRDARRRQPPSLKAKALDAFEVEEDLWPVKSPERGERFGLIRRALERLQELEALDD